MAQTKGPVVNAVGDPPRGHSHSERASHKTHGNRDYRPGPSSSRRPTYKKSRHDCNLCGSRNHRIFNCPSLPMARRLINKRDHNKGSRPQHRTPHYVPGVAHAAAARPSAIPPRKQLRWNTPGRGRFASEINHIMWDQPDQEESDTKINSPDGVDKQLEGSDDDDVGSPLIIEEPSDSEEGLKTAEHYEKMTPYLR